jgi:hypothetical protein
VENAPSYFYDNPYMEKEYARKDRPKGFLFRRDRSTLEVNRRRGLADPPPDLTLMDRFSTSGPCIKLFSDSEFFLNEWLEAEQLRVEEEKRRRKARKAERKAKKAARQPSDATAGKRKIERVKKKVFSKHGVEYQSDVKQVDDYIEVDERTIPKTQSTYDVEATDHSKDSTRETIGTASAPQGRPTKTTTTATTSGTDKQIPMPASGRQPTTSQTTAPSVASMATTTMSPANPQVTTSSHSGPPPLTVQVKSSGQAKVGGPPPLPGEVSTMAAAAASVPIVIDPASIEISRSEMTLEMRIAESRRLAEEQAAIDEARRARLAMEQEKAKSIVPTSPSAGLMAAIRGGEIQLRRADPIKREVQKDTRTMMLESIAGGKGALRKVDRAAEDEKRAREREAEQEDNTIFAALNARRELIADSDEDSDFESSDWGDDD